MFYDYVKDLPLVSDNRILNRGGRMEFSVGHLRKSKADSKGFRAFILHDKLRDVSYRVNENGMLVEYGESYDYHRIFVVNPPDGVKYTNFAVEGDAAEINSFILLLERMQDEYDERRSLFSRFRRFMKDPTGKLLLLVGALYVVVTILVLVYG